MTALACALALMAPPSFESLIVRVRADMAALGRKYPIESAPSRANRVLGYLREVASEARQLPAETHSDGIDKGLLQNWIAFESRRLEIGQQVQRDIADLIPFAPTLIDLEERRRQFEFANAEASAKTLHRLAGEIKQATEALTNATHTPSQGNAAARTLGQLRRHYEAWFRFYDGYDPLFSWWCRAPHQAVVAALDAHQAALLERVVGIKSGDETTIIGFPIGRDALLAELEFERIAYSPEELVTIAEREFAWCEREMARAAKDMGKKDWAEALEAVKQMHVKPGEQPALIRDLAREAITFLEERDLLTIPALAKETWRMEMMSPEAQLRSPFFLGGETILVSYPTDGMAHEAKLMSLRGNNRYFARATVQHELIPGHHMQFFSMERYRPYRTLFETPFWIEGWALYWEMLLWDLGFARTPEERVGMLFWRSHRAARILFSLNFHLGKMTPQECVDLLVNKVGHERENALAEVRRSFGGDYDPLYQAAYMVGGLQVMALKRELVDGGRMTLKQFHDRFLQGNTMPIEFVRANLREESPPSGKPTWRFDD